MHFRKFDKISQHMFHKKLVHKLNKVKISISQITYAHI